TASLRNSSARSNLRLLSWRNPRTVRVMACATGLGLRWSWASVLRRMISAHCNSPSRISASAFLFSHTGDGVWLVCRSSSCTASWYLELRIRSSTVTAKSSCASATVVQARSMHKHGRHFSISETVIVAKSHDRIACQSVGVVVALRDFFTVQESHTGSDVEAVSRGCDHRQREPGSPIGSDPLTKIGRASGRERGG